MEKPGDWKNFGTGLAAHFRSYAKTTILLSLRQIIFHDQQYHET